MQKIQKISFYSHTTYWSCFQYRMKQQLIDLKLKPQQLEMERTLMLLQERDTGGIFSDPVKVEEVFYLL